MAKKDSMQKKVERTEQMDLIEVQPKNAKAIVCAARLYKKLLAARQAALLKEVEQKQHILELVKVAKLQPLDGGKIQFEYDGVIVSVTPRDELVKVKDKTESE